MADVALPSARSGWTISLIVLALAVIQVAFAWSIRSLDPKRDYLSVPPSRLAQDALAFGDTQFLYRTFALEVQNAGDTGGRIVPVKNYDFGRVTGWLEVLDRLDRRSGFGLEMAGGYFGQSQNVADVEPIVRFIMRKVGEDPENRWKALYNAIYLARHRLRDDSLALEVARQLAGYDFEGVEVWAALMPAFILEDHQRYREAMEIVRNAVTRFGSRLSEDDAKWTASYIDFLLQVEAGRAPPRRPSWPYGTSYGA